MQVIRIAGLAFVFLLMGCKVTAQTSRLVADPGASLPSAIGAGGSAYQFVSTSIGETRSVLIGLPKSYPVTHREYPVIIVLDGEASFRPAMTVVSELTSLGHIPESIVVGIPNTNRLRDLTPPGLSVSGSSKNEGGDRFLDFLEKELMPAMKTQFRASGFAVLVGHSSGAIIATYAAATRPAFPFVVLMDSPTHLGDNWLVDRMIDAARNPALSRLRYVSLESRFGYSDSLWNVVKNAAPKTWVLERQHLDNESHVSLPFFGMYLGLRELFQDYQTTKAPQSPTSSTLAYYRDLSKAYGTTVIPSPGLIRQVMEDLEMEGQSKRANDAWDMLVTNYGMPPDSLEWRERLAKLAAQPPLTETVEGLLATPLPKSSDAKQFLGEWHGVEWMNEDDKHDQLVRFRDSSGVLVGETINYPEPGHQLVMPFTYIKLVDGGITWGYMNGMRPRGMLLFEGKLKDGVMKGEMRFGGVRLTMPPGMEHPQIQFELRKQK